MSNFLIRSFNRNTSFTSSTSEDSSEVESSRPTQPSDSSFDDYSEIEPPSRNKLQRIKNTIVGKALSHQICTGTEGFLVGFFFMMLVLNSGNTSSSDKKIFGSMLAVCLALLSFSCALSFAPSGNGVNDDHSEEDSDSVYFSGESQTNTSVSNPHSLRASRTSSATSLTEGSTLIWNSSVAPPSPHCLQRMANHWTAQMLTHPTSIGVQAMFSAIFTRLAWNLSSKDSALTLAVVGSACASSLLLLAISYTISCMSKNGEQIKLSPTRGQGGTMPNGFHGATGSFEISTTSGEGWGDLSSAGGEGNSDEGPPLFPPNYSAYSLPVGAPTDLLATTQRESWQ